jgi:hypothetical protein
MQDEGLGDPGGGPDADYDFIGVTGQPVQWVVPRGSIP